MPVRNLNNAEKRLLRAKAHALHPVVQIAEKGLSDSVLKEIDRALLAHELIKARVENDDRSLRETYCTEICSHLNAQKVQSIGKILVLWRENPEKKKKIPPSKSAPRLKKRDFQ